MGISLLNDPKRQRTSPATILLGMILYFKGLNSRGVEGVLALLGGWLRLLAFSWFYNAERQATHALS